MHMRKQELPAALEVFTLLRKQLHLDSLSNVLQRPSAVTYHVKPVDHDLSIWEQLFRNIQILPVHVHHEILHLISVGKSPQIVIDLRVIPRWEYIYNPFVHGIGQNTLELPVLRISTEFIDGKHIWQAIRLPEFQQVHPSPNGRFRNSERVCDLFSGLLPSQLIDP